MKARKKKRSRFEYQGENFLWYFDDWYVHICSEDKSFVVAYFVGDPFGNENHLEVHGFRFPGINRTKSRPVRISVPKLIVDEWSNSLGAFVNALICWSLNESHSIEYCEID